MRQAAAELYRENHSGCPTLADPARPVPLFAMSGVGSVLGAGWKVLGRWSSSEVPVLSAQLHGSRCEHLHSPAFSLP